MMIVEENISGNTIEQNTLRREKRCQPLLMRAFTRTRPSSSPRSGTGVRQSCATGKAMEEMAERVKSGAEVLVLITPHGPLFRDAISVLAEETLTGSLSLVWSSPDDIFLPYR